MFEQESVWVLWEISEYLKKDEWSIRNIFERTYHEDFSEEIVRRNSAIILAFYEVVCPLINAVMSLVRVLAKQIL